MFSIKMNSKINIITSKYIFLFLFLLAIVFLFQDILFKNMIFIGDSDRLNNFLNIRKFQIDYMLLNLSPPSWNENMFMGLSLTGLHWMLPSGI